MREVLLVLVLVAACSSGGTPAKNDGGVGICPANPQFCGGMCCGTLCAETALDKNHCGDCTTQCGEGAVCNNGKCGCLPTGTGDVQTDVQNCGTCGHACGEGATCAGGKCLCGGVQCTGSQVCCNGMCSDSCVLPDMSSGLPPCDCSGLAVSCVLSNTCVAQDCCFEDTLGILPLMCSATPTLCAPSPTN